LANFPILYNPLACGLFEVQGPSTSREPTRAHSAHSTPLHSTPLHSTPLHSTPLHFTPLHSTPLHSTPLHSTHAATLVQVSCGVISVCGDAEISREAAVALRARCSSLWRVEHLAQLQARCGHTGVVSRCRVRVSLGEG
jgi:hypothetical protein